ncbi:hypothetical protein TSUD_97090 [Trifolium subterraneum]|nr:hypothetical protein TSUD_97090 [Trifolium subterraneum]
MKAILRWFELVSGLKVNFSKSRLIGVNVASSFMEGAASFLNCKICTIPFVYLGLPIGANPRLTSTWDPVLKTIEKRLSSWKNRYVSLGGSVVLINSVLASIPVFYLSFLKLPSKVRRAVVRIQRNFLWGGAAGVKVKIPWVSWKEVCRPKCEGGLGVRDLKWFNVSFLAKLRWRLLGEDDLLWKRVLEARYENVARMVGDWTKDVFVKKLGNGGATRFWLDHWVGVAPLKEADVLYLGGGVGSESLDRHLCGSDHKGTGFVVLCKWSMGRWAPSKVIVFSWQALLGRLPTRANLAYRGILPNGVGSWCPWCEGIVESEDHLLVTCPLAWAVWSLVHRWFGVVSVVPVTLSSLCESFLKVYRKGKQGLKGILLVWHAVVWVLWRARNDKIFSAKEVDAEVLFDKIQITSWKWLVAKKINAPCLLYEWCINLFDCINR